MDKGVSASTAPSPASVPYVSEVKTLAAYPTARPLTSQEIEAIKPFIDQWAASFKIEEFANFSSKIEIIEALLLPKCRINLQTRYERRKVEARTRPFNRKEMRDSGMSVDLNEFPLWSYDMGLSPLRGASLAHKEIKVDGSDEVFTCGTCNGDGRNECDSCRGDGKVSCPNCKGGGTLTCGGGAIRSAIARDIIGTGQIFGAGCGGSGRITVKKNGHEYQERCKKCGGRGNVNCSKCNSRGEITCSTCGGRGQITCRGCEGHGQLISSRFLVSTEQDLQNEKVVSSWGELPQDVAAWLETMAENKIATHELDRLSDSFTSQYPPGGEIATALAGLRASSIKEETWTSNEELLNVESGGTHSRVSKEWADEFYEPICRVKYTLQGKSFEVWLSIPRPTHAVSKDHKKSPGHEHWREGTFCFSSKSPFSDAIDSWCAQAAAEKKAGKYPEALKSAKRALAVSPHHALAKSISRKIRWSNAGTLLVSFVVLGIISAQLMMKTAGVVSEGTAEAIPGGVFVLTVFLLVLVFRVGRTRNRNLILGAALGILCGLATGMESKFEAAQKEHQKAVIAAETKAREEQVEKDRIAAEEKAEKERVEAEAKAAAERAEEEAKHEAAAAKAARERIEAEIKAEKEYEAATKVAKEHAEAEEKSAKERAEVEASQKLAEAEAKNGAEKVRLEKAVQAAAMLAQGDKYANGTDVPKDEAEAVKWYLKAAEEGSSMAQHKLGLCYQNGTGVPKDGTKAMEWYQKAADQGLANSQYAVGRICEGISRGEDAVRWYEKASAQGFAEAQFRLGLYYDRGLGGLPVNTPKAISLFQKSAENGCAQGQVLLGACLLKGIGMPQNRAEALAWIRKAAKQGDPDAKKILSGLGEQE